MKYLMMSFVCFLLAACSQTPLLKDTDLLKQEILDAEHNFARMAADSGVEKAFVYFAAPDAVMKRGNRLVTGHDSIELYMKSNSEQGVQLSWEADFVDVSASGDLAYTYGKFVYAFPDSTGSMQQQQGIFHTVWKRQPDGKWKFVWD